jgi:hypothetical protein
MSEPGQIRCASEAQHNGYNLSYIYEPFFHIKIINADWSERKPWRSTKVRDIISIEALINLN